MMAPQARRKGGQKRIETEVFGDHIIDDHAIIKKTVEEGLKGEQVALVLKDFHTQYKYLHPSQSKGCTKQYGWFEFESYHLVKR